MRPGIRWSAIAACIALAAAMSYADDAPSVDEIVKRANHAAYYQGQDGRAQVVMTIKDAQGRERQREFTILRKNLDDKDGDQNFYVYFHKPADDRGMVFMVWKHVGEDDDRWLYLPGLDVVKQIAASDERTSFVGSHFFYEDVSGRGIEEDTHELAETTDDYYVVKSTPKKPGAVEFDRFTSWIHKSTFIPVKIAFEQGGEVYRIAEAKKIEDVQGYKTVTQAVMKDMKIGGETQMAYTKVEYDVGLPDDIFTERYLRRAPRKFLE